MVKSKTKILSATDRKQHVGRAFALSFGKADRAARQHRSRGQTKEGGNGNERRPRSRGNHHGSANGGDHRGQIQDSIEPFKSTSGVDVTEKVKELISLARDQGYLTYDDIDDVLADASLTPKDLDEIHARLGNLDIEIVEQAEADRAKQTEAEEEDERSRFDSMDDPVRMYMKQMGKVPLLTREQEVAICKRIEEAELQLKHVIYSFGFTAKEHIALAEKLISEPPKERFDRVIIDKKLDIREAHLKELRNLVKQVRQLDRQADLKYAAWQQAGKTTQARRLAEYQKLDKKIQALFPNFCYKQKVIEEMMNVA